MTNEGRKPKGMEPTHEAAEQRAPATREADADRAMHTDSGNSAHETAVEPAIDRRIQNHLGRKLKEVYDELVRQPVPDKFHKLLEELERKEKKH